MRTTVNLDDELLRRDKERAARQGRALSEVASEALRVSLAEQTGPRHEVTLPTVGGSGLKPGVDLEDKDALAALLDEDDRAAR